VRSFTLGLSFPLRRADRAQCNARGLVVCNAGAISSGAVARVDDGADLFAGGGELRCHLRQGRLQLRAKRAHSYNDRGGNSSSKETVLDGRCSGLVLRKSLGEYEHVISPGASARSPGEASP
jgi:hypothetical protein